MIPKEHHIKTNRTARLYTLGEFTGEAKHLWIVTHGYMNLARDFIKNFEPIADENTLIVAPEGLSRFYTKGFAGVVGASWMTREDRQHEMYDYIEYLDRVAEGIIERLETPPARITALGFSQGGPTIIRWAALGSVEVDEVVLWAGDTPTDLNFEAYKEKMKDKMTWFAIADEDEMISKNVYDLSIKLLSEKQFNIKEFHFSGKHTMPPEALRAFKSKLLKPSQGQ